MNLIEEFSKQMPIIIDIPNISDYEIDYTSTNTCVKNISHIFINDRLVCEVYINDIENTFNFTEYGKFIYTDIILKVINKKIINTLPNSDNLFIDLIINNKTVEYLYKDDNTLYICLYDDNERCKDKTNNALCFLRNKTFNLIFVSNNVRDILINDFKQRKLTQLK